MSGLGPDGGHPTDRRTANRTPAHAPSPLAIDYPSIDGLARLMAALVGGADRDPTTFVTRCGWCRRFQVEGRWLDLDEAATELPSDEDALAPTITHGICEACVTSFERALDEAG